MPMLRRLRRKNHDASFFQQKGTTHYFFRGTTLFVQIQIIGVCSSSSSSICRHWELFVLVSGIGFCEIWTEVEVESQIQFLSLIWIKIVHLRLLIAALGRCLVGGGDDWVFPHSYNLCRSCIKFIGGVGCEGISWFVWGGGGGIFEWRGHICGGEGIGRSSELTGHAVIMGLDLSQRSWIGEPVICAFWKSKHSTINNVTKVSILYVHL